MNFRALEVPTLSINLSPSGSKKAPLYPVKELDSYSVERIQQDEWRSYEPPRLHLFGNNSSYFS